PVVEREGERHDPANRETAVDYPRPLPDGADPEDARLGCVDDRVPAVGTEVAVVVDGEGAAGQVARGRRAGAATLRQLGGPPRELQRREAVRILDVGDHQPAFGV